MYSLPLSTRNFFIRRPNLVSIILSNSLNRSKTSDLCFRKYANLKPEASSLNVTKYLDPPREFVEKGPHTSECMYSPGFVTDRSHSLRVNFSRCAFPN